MCQYQPLLECSVTTLLSKKSVFDREHFSSGPMNYFDDEDKSLEVAENLPNCIIINLIKHKLAKVNMKNFIAKYL